MITFGQGRLQFNYRAVGVALNNNQVLLHKSEKDHFWSLPGGRVEFLETASDTLKREMQEELNIEVKVERLLWVVENFFEYDYKSYHELALYFLMFLPSGSNLYSQTEQFEGKDEGRKLIFQWHKLDALEHIELYPRFLHESLISIPKFTVHIVHNDDHSL